MRIFLLINLSKKRNVIKSNFSISGGARENRVPFQGFGHFFTRFCLKKVEYSVLQHF